MRRGTYAPAGAAVVCVLLLQALGSCTTSDDDDATLSPSRSVQAESFPGGGAILFSSGAGLQAASPDGSTKTIAGHFLGAEPFPGLEFFPSGQLLAWKLTREDNDYYVMRMDGTDRRHVLRPTRRHIPFGVQVSPEGTKLAYIRETYLGPGRARYELLVLDLSSDRTKNLGRIAPAGPKGDFTHVFAWNSNSAFLLVQSRNRRSVDWIDPETRTRGRYLLVTDRRIVDAYARVRPNAAPATEIRPIGMSPNPRFAGFAVLVSGRDGSDPAVIVLKNGPTRAFAVPSNATGVELTWSVTSTRFLLASWVDERRGPTDWVLSVGDARTGELRRIVRARRSRSSLLDPDGDVLMYAPDTRHWVFVSVDGCPLDGCRQRIEMEGFPLAWVA